MQQEPLGILSREGFNIRRWDFTHLLKGPEEWTQDQASRSDFQNIEGPACWDSCSLCPARKIGNQEATTGTFEPKSTPFEGCSRDKGVSAATTAVCPDIREKGDGMLE